MDIGGGHFLDVRRPQVLDFLFQFMPKNEWNLFNRDSQIAIHNQAIHHPIEANLWQLADDLQVEYLKSIAFAGCNLGEAMPSKFTEWIRWKLGSMISENYMLPYNKKMFGNDLEDLGTYWLEKLPNVSFDETLRSCLNKKPYGKQPGHAQFYYPKNYGYGELWLRMASKLGNKIRYNTVVSAVDFSDRTIYTDCGLKLSARAVVTTIPWKALKNSLNLYDGAQNDFQQLKNNSIKTSYHRNNLETDAHWIYYPDEDLAHHRSLVRHNFLKNSKGFWTETTGHRINEIDCDSSYSYVNDFAYPLNTSDKPEIMKRLLVWAASRGVYGLGRWGQHEHYNSDVTVEKALTLADELL
jgi:protoporphyrinogen oxidase